MWGRDSYGIWGGRVHTAVFKMDNQQGPTVLYRELCSMSCGSLDGREAWGRMEACICMAESLCCPPETITALLLGSTPIQNKKFFFFLSNKNGSLVVDQMTKTLRMRKWYFFLTRNHLFYPLVLSSNIRVWLEKGAGGSEGLNPELVPWQLGLIGSLLFLP